MRGDFVIENDFPSTPSTSVILGMDISGATQMRFGNTPAARDSAGWETYSSTKTWTLSSGGGKKTVYAAFRNSSGDIATVSDDIQYIPTPTLPFSTGLTLWYDASDTGSITQSAGNISQWNDKSGNNYHGEQPSGSNQPNYVAGHPSSSTVDFNGTSDYLAIQTLNYNAGNQIDGLFVCTVFKTPNTQTGYNNNWAFLDFDRSEYFDFYNNADGIGFSYASSGIKDIAATGLGLNDNNWHVACASFDNTQTNDTTLTVNGTQVHSSNQVGIGQSIGTTTTRYGFIGDGSEAGSFNAGRNNIYYQGGIAELIYFDSAVNTTNRKDIECYLGEKWSITVAGCNPNRAPVASVSYAPEITTSGNVIATLGNESTPLTITNNAGSNTYTFTSNGTFTFEFEDSYGNTGSTLAKVDWIDPYAPLPVGTGSLNVAPIIKSHSGATSVTLTIGSGATDITTISATDNTFNVVGEYGKASLSGNTWLNINHYEMCSSAVVVSHRGDVNGEIQRAPRVRNKTGTGFQVKVDNYNSTIGALSTDIDYIVMNAGSHDFGAGLLVEVGSQSTSPVACNASNNPTPQSVNFLSSFSIAPAVLHTISTENDSSWVVSGVNGDTGARDSEPSATKMGTVLQRSFNSCTHASEDVDYFAFAPGNYTLLDGTLLDAVVSSDTIGSVTATGNPIDFSTAFPLAPQTVLVSQMGEDGGNGGYAQIHTGGSQVTTDQVFATIDEDGPGADRTHTNEVAAAIAFDKASGQFWEENTISYSITGGADSSDFTIDPGTGKLDFVSPHFPNNYVDANSDGIYEVIVSACDSHCNSQCSTQTILADTRDTIAPIIASANFASGALLPGGSQNIYLDYSDDLGGSGIDTSDGVTDLTSNIAPLSMISATPATTWGVPPHPDSIVNGIISTSGAFDYEYHSDTGNAFIEFEWETPQKLGNMKIYNRTGCCSERLTNASIQLYSATGGLLYTHILGDTTGVSIIDIDFEALGEIHNVSRLRLDSTGGNYINIREIEIFPLEENIELYKWDGISSWGDNIAHEFIDFSSKVFTPTNANYDFSGLPYGKYKYLFTIEDISGNISTEERVFYIDEPEFIVSTPEIDIGTLSYSENIYSPPLMLTVKTVGAPFDLAIEESQAFLSGVASIDVWDETTGYGYELSPFGTSLSSFTGGTSIVSQSGSINPHGEKNTYTYTLRFGAKIGQEQAAGDYEGSLNFGIDLEY